MELQFLKSYFSKGIKFESALVVALFWESCVADNKAVFRVNRSKRFVDKRVWSPYVLEVKEPNLLRGSVQDLKWEAGQSIFFSPHVA